MEKLILGMLEKQDGLNIKTCGNGWRAGATKDAFLINWLRCIRKEASELIDSFPWEHWKGLNRKPDIDNAQIELVDIWFFLMSYNMGENSNSLEDIAKDLSIISKMQRPEKRTSSPIENAEDLIETTFIAARRHSEALNYSFFLLMDSLDVDFNLLNDLYVGKLVLNRFRQDNGYKDGTYVKIWSGLEDNRYMLKIIREQPGLSEEDIYANLKLIYTEKGI